MPFDSWLWGSLCRRLSVTSWWLLLFQIPCQTLCVFFMDSDFIQSNSWLWYYKIHDLPLSFFLLELLKPRMWLMLLELYNMGTILSWRKCKCLHLLYLLVLSLILFCYFIYLRNFFLLCIFMFIWTTYLFYSSSVFVWSLLSVSFLMCLRYWPCSCEVLCLFTKHVSSNIDFVVCWLFYHDDFLVHSPRHVCYLCWCWKSMSRTGDIRHNPQQSTHCNITVALGIITVLHNTTILGLSIVNSWFLGMENASILGDSTACVSLDAGSTMVPMIFVLCFFHPWMALASLSA